MEKIDRMYIEVLALRNAVGALVALNNANPRLKDLMRHGEEPIISDFLHSGVSDEYLADLERALQSYRALASGQMDPS